MAARPNLSAPFSHREFNGEHLIGELKKLRLGQLSQKELTGCALTLKALAKVRAPELAQRLRALAKESSPALGTLLKEWSTKLGRDEDVPVLVSHVQRLAMTSALLDAARRGNALLPGKGGKR